MKTFFVLGGSYAGFKVRRIAQCGRVWLVRVIGYYPEASENRSRECYEPEPNPYWFVQVRAFSRQKDLDLVPEMRRLPHDNCTFRFCDLESARKKFSELAKHPRMVEEELKRQKSRTLFTERARASVEQVVLYFSEGLVASAKLLGDFSLRLEHKTRLLVPVIAMSRSGIRCPGRSFLHTTAACSYWIESTCSTCRAISRACSARIELKSACPPAAPTLMTGLESHKVPFSNGRQTSCDSAGNGDLGPIGKKGAAAALERLEQAEERAHARLEAALGHGNPVEIAAAQDFWLKCSETLRRLDLAVEIARRQEETLVPLRVRRMRSPIARNGCESELHNFYQARPPH
jgi:hypothetical protein